MPYKSEHDFRASVTTGERWYRGSLNTTSTRNSTYDRRSFTTSGTNRNVPFHNRTAFGPITVTDVPFRGPKIGYEIVYVKKGDKVTRKGKTFIATRDYTYRRAKYLIGVKRKFHQSSRKLTGLFFNSLNANYSEIFPYGATTLRAENLNVADYRQICYTTGSFAETGVLQGWPNGPFCTGFASYGQDALTNALAEMETWKPELLSQIRSKAKDQTFNLAQAAAESNQTRKMIIDMVMRLATALLNLKKLKFSKAASILFPTNSKSLANDWLTWQYGIRPLISDIDGAMKALARTNDTQEYDISVIRRNNQKLNSTVSNNYGIRFKTVKSGYIEYSLKLKIKLKVKNDTARFVSSLGLTNPIALGYELIPFSFVVDWILPIGDYLNSMDSFLGVEIVDAHWTYSVKFTGREDVSVGGIDHNAWKWESANFGYDKIISRRQRSLIPNPASLIGPTFPELKDPLSFTHIMNALALFRQLR